MRWKLNKRYQWQTELSLLTLSWFLLIIAQAISAVKLSWMMGNFLSELMWHSVVWLENKSIFPFIVDLLMECLPVTTHWQIRGRGSTSSQQCHKSWLIDSFIHWFVQFWTILWRALGQRMITKFLDRLSSWRTLTCFVSWCWIARSWSDTFHSIRH
jgi:hypothetical protein